MVESLAQWVSISKRTVCVCVWGGRSVEDPLPALDTLGLWKSCCLGSQGRGTQGLCCGASPRISHSYLTFPNLPPATELMLPHRQRGPLLALTLGLNSWFCSTDASGSWCSTRRVLAGGGGRSPPPRALLPALLGLWPESPHGASVCASRKGQEN